MRTYKPKKLFQSVPLNLTDHESAVVVAILRQLGEITDPRRRVDVAALAMKIGIIEADNPAFEALRVACGLEEIAP